MKCNIILSEESLCKHLLRWCLIPFIVVPGDRFYSNSRSRRFGYSTSLHIFCNRITNNECLFCCLVSSFNFSIVIYIGWFITSSNRLLLWDFLFLRWLLSWTLIFNFSFAGISISIISINCVILMLFFQIECWWRHDLNWYSFFSYEGLQ